MLIPGWVDPIADWKPPPHIPVITHRSPQHQGSETPLAGTETTAHGHTKHLYSGEQTAKQVSLAGRVKLVGISGVPLGPGRLGRTVPKPQTEGQGHSVILRASFSLSFIHSLI
jgi:hypothetical protein